MNARRRIPAYSLLLVLSVSVISVGVATPAAAADKAVPQSIGRSLEKLRKEKKLKIAYFGGTATAGPTVKNSWRERTTAWFRGHHPDAKITAVDAAADGGSEYGAFRFRKDIMEQDPDLVFVEFAIDDADKDEQRVLRGLEGIVRQLWTSNPWAELVFVYTTSKQLAAGYERGELPKATAYHQAVARHYGVPVVDLGRALADAVRGGKETWESLTVDGVRPNETGSAIYFGAVEAFLTAHRSDPAAEPVVVLPDPSVKDPFSGAYVAKAAGIYAPGWRKELKPAESQPTYIEADRPGTDFVHSFTGSTVGLLLLVGPDGGDLEWSIDDGPPQRLTTFDAAAGGATRLKFVILADALSAGKEHTLTIRVHSEKRPEATGTKVRIAAIMMHCDC